MNLQRRKKIVRKANYEQHKGMPCFVCGNNFSDCPHSFVETGELGDSLRMLDLWKVGKGTDAEEAPPFNPACEHPVVRTDDYCESCDDYLGEGAWREAVGEGDN